MAENSNLLQALQSLIQTENSQINTAVDGIIESYSAGIASVKPIPQKRFNDGSQIAYPVIPNVPVMWPRFAGDTAGVKGPVRPETSACWCSASRPLTAAMMNGVFPLTMPTALWAGSGRLPDVVRKTTKCSFTSTTLTWR